MRRLQSQVPQFSEKYQAVFELGYCYGACFEITQDN